MNTNNIMNYAFEAFKFDGLLDKLVKFIGMDNLTVIKGNITVNSQNDNNRKYPSYHLSSGDYVVKFSESNFEVLPPDIFKMYYSKVSKEDDNGFFKVKGKNQDIVIVDEITWNDGGILKFASFCKFHGYPFDLNAFIENCAKDCWTGNASNRSYSYQGHTLFEGDRVQLLSDGTINIFDAKDEEIRKLKEQILQLQRTLDMRELEKQTLT